MLDKMRLAYFRRAGKLDPSLSQEQRAAVLQQLSLAAHIVDQVEDHIRAIIDDGRIEQHNSDYADKIAALPERKRGWALFN